MSDTSNPTTIEIKSTLMLKNVTVNGRRTSIRLEPEMWNELKNIAKREQCTIHEICSLINLRKHENTSLTAAIRVFLMLYFRAAATETGHDKAGHGDFEYMKKRAGVESELTVVSNKKSRVEQEMEKRLAPHLIEQEPQKESARG